MHANATTPILLLCCGLTLAANAHAQSLPTVDDFATGPAMVSLTGGDSTTKQTGSHILGGSRLTQLVFSANPFHQITEMRIHKGDSQTAPSALIFSEGFQSSFMFNLQYGTANQSLHADLTPYNRFRLHFFGIAGTLNFNIEAYTGTTYSQWSCNLNPASGPILVDFPFADAGGSGANLAAIDQLNFIFQAAGDAVETGLTEIEFVPASAPPGDVTC